MTERSVFIRQHFSSDRLPPRLKTIADAYGTIADQIAALSDDPLIDSALNKLRAARDATIMAVIQIKERQQAQP